MVPQIEHHICAISMFLSNRIYTHLQPKRHAELNPCQSRSKKTSANKQMGTSPSKVSLSNSLCSRGNTKGFVIVSSNYGNYSDVPERSRYSRDAPLKALYIPPSDHGEPCPKSYTLESGSTTPPAPYRHPSNPWCYSPEPGCKRLAPRIGPGRSPEAWCTDSASS